MTDPPSIAASISGLVTLADVVFGRIYKYVKAVKKAPKEIAALSAEIGELYGVLSKLHLVSRQLEHDHADSTTRIHHVNSCYQTLDHVKSILDRDETSSSHDERLESLKRRLRWPFTSSEVKELIAEIERHKTTLGLALSVDCMSGLLQALSKHDEIRDSINGITTELKERHAAETRVAINKETQEILNSFGKVDSRSNFEMSRKLRSPGTGLWLTESEEFRHWLETKNARLWLYGIPGAGKTVLAASAIEEALRVANPCVAIAFFYCDYKNPASQDLTNILGSLAQQFAKQDEESLAKLRRFYETQNPDHRPDFRYDPDSLLDVLRAMTLTFDCAMIIVDGLDECGTNAALVVDSLTTLNDGDDATVKTLFLSRNEIEIRDRLENYTKVAIAARSSDLRLYVGSEIELRTRKKRLRIKDPSLKEQILERLVKGAEGMFRWVTCQMDFLSELPNDAARRTALDSLPPDLNSTYERVLIRVNQSNPDTRKLVRRALRWIANYSRYGFFTVNALCEAVSIDFGDTRRNPHAIPDEYGILYWCSSLVRKSENGEYLELAHFTVKEFLQQIDPLRNDSIGAYRLDPPNDLIILVRVCLTYLNFEDFDKSGLSSRTSGEERFQEYPFRRLAVDIWPDAARNSSDDHALFPLMQRLFSPSKPNTFITWLYDVAESMVPPELETGNFINSVCAETTPLHWAAFFGLDALATWLITSGCDVNRYSPIGTALHCALGGWQIFNLRLPRFKIVFFERKERGQTELVKLLLKNGANPNIPFDTVAGKISTLVIALCFGILDSVPQLIDKGGVLDTHCLDLLEKETLYGGEPESLLKIIKHTNNFSMPPKERGRLLQLATKTEASIAIRLVHQNTDLPDQKGHYEQMLRTAAEFGQLEIIRTLLDDRKLDVDVTDDGTGMTALHHAVETNQLEVVQVLVDHGADSGRMDSEGRTALHYSVLGNNVCCLEFLLQQDANPSLRDAEGMTVWHLAAEEGNVQALRVLLSRATAPNSFDTDKVGTPLLCASASESKAAADIAPSVDCSLTETASDGSSLIHYAVRSGSLEVIELLFEQRADPLTVTHNGSSAMHHAIEGESQELAHVVRILLEHGVDPAKARKNGDTPLDVIVRKISKNIKNPSRLNRLFATGLILSRSLLRGSKLASNMRSASEFLYLACSAPFLSADQTVADLLELHLDLNTYTVHDKTALMAAAQHGWVTRLDKLLIRGADPCVRNNSGLNALHYACYTDQKDCVARLRETAIDWNSRSTAYIIHGLRKMVIPLHIAVLNADSKVLEYLLSEKLISNIDACTNCGETPLILAVHAGASRNVSKLLANNADTTIIDVFGNNAIHWAAQLGFEDIVDEFIEHGSDLGLPNTHGLTPELLARKYGHVGLAKIIWNHVGGDNDDLTATPDSQKLRKSNRASEALKLAIDLEDLELCKRFIQGGMDLATGFDECLGCRPLLYSIQRGRLAIAQYLLAQGASTEGSTCEYFTTRGFIVFHHAAVLGSADLLRVLLEQAPSEIYVNRDPIHPLHLAVLTGAAECIEMILDHVSLGKGRKAADQLGSVHEAVDQMVEKQVRRDMMDWSWCVTPEEWVPEFLETAKPLHIAADKGHVQILRMLLEYGAYVNDEDANLWTPLHHAAYNGHMECTLLLLNAGANPNALTIDIHSPCIEAIICDQIDVVELLLKRGADIRQRSCDGESALFIAAREGARDCFVLLMTRYDLWTEDVYGQSVLSRILKQSSIFSKRFVMNVAPTAGAYESRMWDILNIVIEYRSATAVKMLLRRLSTCLLPGFVDRRCTERGTPLNTAATSSKVEVIGLLLDAGASLEIEGSEHGTPLMAACATGRLAAVKTLVSRGAKTSYMSNGQVYSAFAAAKNHPLIRRWLLVGRFTECPKLLTCG